MSSSPQLDQCPQCKQDLGHFRQGLDDPASLRLCPNCHFPVVLVAGKYRLEKILGEGAFGKVYLARHVQLTRDAERAIKILKPEMFEKPGFAERFIREVQVTSSISQRNEHIVRVYDDFGQIQGVGHFYVMEFLQGGSLLDLIEDSKGLPSLELCLHIFGQMCKGMAAAHEGEIVHRDLKPENVVLIERAGDKHFVKIVDFGIARPLDTEAEELKLTQGALGTPLYMAPEQCAHKDIDARTDIYSLGIILFELLVGYPPFAPPGVNVTPFDLLTSHMMAPPPSLREARPDRNIPQALEDVVHKAMAKKPTERFQTVADFWNAVARAVPQLSGTASFGSSAAAHQGISLLSPSTPTGSRAMTSDKPAAQGAVVSIDDVEIDSTQNPTGLLDDGNATGYSAPVSSATPEPEIFAPAHNDSSNDQAMPLLSTSDLQDEFQQGNRKLMVLGVLLFLILSGGVGLWFGFSRTGANTLPKKGKQPLRSQALPTIPRPQNPTRVAPEPPRPEPAPADAGAPKIRPPQRVKKVVRRRRKRRRFKRRRVRPRVVAPRPPARPHPKGCPTDAGYQWTRLRLKPGATSIKLLSGNGKVHSSDGTTCLGFSGSGRLKIQLNAFGYRPCTLKLRAGKLYRRFTLKTSNPDGIETGGDDYCK